MSEETKIPDQPTITIDGIWQPASRKKLEKMYIYVISVLNAPADAL